MPKQILAQEYLKECLHYDPDTGVFTWKERPLRHFKNDRYRRAWHSRHYHKSPGGPNDQGYILIRVCGRQTRAHRLAWLYMTGEMPEGEIDHINHDRADNTWANLREIPKPENQKNMSLNRRNTSGYCGVSFSKQTGRWEAYIGTGKDREHLGRFASITDAISARKVAMRRLGFHENHGRPNE